MTQRIKVLTYRVNGKSFEVRDKKITISDIMRRNTFAVMSEIDKTINALETLKISYQITYINEVVKK